jgi:hypothetical protein
MALLCKSRALLCKPSRDVDSRKLTLAVVLDQGLAKRRRKKGIVCKPDRYIRKPNLELVRNSSKETEGKRKQRETDQELGQNKDKE